MMPRPLRIEYEGGRYHNNGNADVWFAHQHYHYDKVGREVARWREEGGNKGERFTFSPTNQLTNALYKADNAWTENPVNPALQQQYVYTADKLNRASLVENGVVTNYALNNNLNPSNNLNQYTNVGGTQVAYDGNFNLSAFGNATATYDAMNQLVAVNNGNGTAQFVYDGLGRCVKRTVAGQTLLFTYDEWNPIVEWDSAGNWKAWTIYGVRTDEVLLRNSASAGLLIYKQDNQGSVTFVLNGPTNVADQYSYDAFGRPTILDGNGNPRPSVAKQRGQS